MPSLSRPTVFLAVILCMSATLFGQANRGSVRGLVRDGSGAAVPNAKVECKNVGTSLAIQSMSTKEGEYVFPALIPGDYQVKVESPGFRRAVSETVRVYVGDVTRVDIDLRVGTVEESIQVSGSAALVRPDSAAATTVLTGAEYENLPLAAVSRLRIPTDFALLTPGVLGGQQRPGRSQTATTSISIDGSADGTVDVLVDGMSAGQISSFGSFTEVAVPVDAIQEFNVVKGAFSAEYGYVRTGLINFSLKSGTNRLHGSLFENLRNQNLNARAFFEQKKLPFHQNNFGGTISGPVMLPRIYNGRDRTFFMFSSDDSLFRGTSQVVLYTSPTEAMLRGDFSGLRTATGQVRTIYDPATTVSDGRGGFTRQPFSGNIVPVARIDSIAAKVAALYPKPPSSAPDSNFLGRGGATFLNNYAYNTKVDHRFTDKHTLSVSWNRTKIPRITNSNPYENTPLWNGLNQNFSSHEVRITYNAILTPNTLNNFQFGVNRWLNNVRTQSYGEDWPNRLGVKGVGGDGSLPAFAFSSDSYPQISSTRWDANVEQNLQIRNTTTLIRGRHSVKLGFEMRNQQVKTRNWQNQNGTFSFSFLQTALNASSQSGNAFASFLLGYPNAGSISTPLHVASIHPYYAGFVQDDFKVSSRLTLNLGLRYDLDFAAHEQYDRASIFDLTTPNPSAGNLPGALVFLGSGEGRIGRSTYEDVHKGNFAPRIGLAYQVNRLTVLRAGYGLSYSGNGLLNSGLGFNTTANFQSQDQGASPAFLLKDGMPTNFRRPPFIDPGFGNGNNVTTSIISEAGRMPVTHTWRLDIQRELPRSVLFEAGYAGTRGLHLNASGLRQFNQLPASRLAFGTLLNADINSAAAQQAGIRAPFPGYTGVVRQALRPYPQVLNVSSMEDKIGSSAYHAFETRLQKRFTAGMQFLVSYTFSKNMTDVQSALAGISGSGIQDAANRRAEWAVAGFDTPHNLLVSTIYELPFGQGRHFLNRRGLVNYVLGGWSVSGVLTYQSGVPLRISQSNRLPLFNAAQRPDVLLGAAARNDISYSVFDPAIDRLYNPAAFAEAGADRFGSAGPRLPGIRDFGVRREDVAVRKAVVIRERLRTEINAQLFNILNRNQWGSPNDNRSSSDFGKIASAGPGRFLQLGLKLVF